MIPVNQFSNVFMKTPDSVRVGSAQLFFFAALLGSWRGPCGLCYGSSLFRTIYIHSALREIGV